jgi:hypothetical protein
MPILYTLSEYKLNQSSAYKAVIHPIYSARLEDVIERMLSLGTTVNRPDMLSTLEIYFTALELMLLEGVNVNTPCANYTASIGGVFTGPGDSFDPQRHQIRPSVSPGPRLRQAFTQRAQVIKGEARRYAPNPTEFIDTNSGLHNSHLTPGGIGQLLGYRLKFDHTDPQQGLFLIAVGGGSQKISVVAHNKPRELTFQIPPDLSAGRYHLEVRTVLYSGQELCAEALKAVLEVG